DLGGVGRVGRVAGALQRLGEAAHVAAGLQRLLVARVVLQHAHVVGEALGGRGIGTELRRLSAALAVHVLVGAGGGAFAAPPTGLDAEQVVGAAAAVALDLAPAPAGLQRGLRDQGACVHAQFL